MSPTNLLHISSSVAFEASLVARAFDHVDQLLDHLRIDGQAMTARRRILAFWGRGGIAPQSGQS
jgi:hypothetical protein